MSRPPGIVLVAPDKFKGSLDAAAVARSLAAGIARQAPDAEVLVCPVADGGEGTLECALAAGFTAVPVQARGPVGEPVTARIAVRDSHAVVELAEVCGWPRLPGSGPAPLDAGTHGVGDALSAALDLGCSRITLGLGGSLSTDGGLGMLQALGARATDAHGRELAGGGGALRTLQALDLAHLDRRILDVDFTLATDVGSPLLGPSGAARLFGPQKGADPEQVDQLEAGLVNLAGVVEVLAGRAVRHVPGCGAAGGVAVTAVGLLRARIRPGAQVFADLTDLQRLVERANVVVTGEGRWDRQTEAGKGPMHVVRTARAAGKSVMVVAGAIDVSEEALVAAGVERGIALLDLDPDPAVCMDRAEALLVEAGARLTTFMFV